MSRFDLAKVQFESTRYSPEITMYLDALDLLRKEVTIIWSNKHVHLKRLITHSFSHSSQNLLSLHILPVHGCLVLPGLLLLERQLVALLLLPPLPLELFEGLLPISLLLECLVLIPDGEGRHPRCQSPRVVLGHLSGVAGLEVKLSQGSRRQTLTEHVFRHPGLTRDLDRRLLKRSRWRM